MINVIERIRRIEVIIRHIRRIKVADSRFTTDSTHPARVAFSKETPY